MQLSKTDIPSYFLLGSLLLALVTGWNELQNLVEKDKYSQIKINKLETKTQNLEGRVTSLEKGEERYHEFAKVVNGTMVELTGVVRELKGSFEASKK